MSGRRQFASKHRYTRQDSNYSKDKALWERKKLLKNDDFSAAINSREQLTPRDNAHTYALELKELKLKEAGEYDPYENTDIEHPTTNFETLIHLLKGSLGTGILAMPLAFYHSGYALGVVATALIGSLCLYCMHLLVRSEYELCKRRQVPNLSYPAVAEAALMEGPTVFQKLAPYSGHCVNTFLLIYQLGTCSVYTVFIAENIQNVWTQYYGEVDEKIIMTIFLLPLILINFIKNLKFLAPFTTLANFITVVSFAIILYYLVKEDITIENREAVGNFRDYPLYFGTVLFALEAIGVIMPLKNEMKNPQDFASTFGVLNIGMTTIIILYIGMGLLGYLAYGSTVGGSISYTIDPTDIPAQVCKIMLAIAIYISHALQMYVAIDITWNHYLQPKIEKSQYLNFWEYAIRTLLVVITFGLAVAVPYIDLFISLFGALCLAALGIAFPAIIDMTTNWYTRKGLRGKLAILSNTLVIIFAIFGLVVGTYTSLQKIVEKFGETSSSTTTNSTMFINTTST